MGNGEVTVSFDGINLDHCLIQGMEFTGYAKCEHCKQVYAFRVHLKTKRRIRKFEESLIEGKTVTTRVPDDYDVSIDFSGNFDPDNIPAITRMTDDESDALKPCEPCSRCTVDCEKLKNR